jgi:YesN/AraC family two-component response regulator
MKDFKIFKSVSGKDGLEVFNSNPIDVVVTDLKMPEMDGIEFIKKIKEIDQSKNCILLTGYFENKIVNDKAINSMIFKYVMKPFKMKELKSTILEAVK